MTEARTFEQPLPAGPGEAAALPAVDLVGVEKEFHSQHGDVRAVKGVDRATRRGEFFLLLGPSGCGKTTTLRMVAGCAVRSPRSSTWAPRPSTQ